MASPIVMDRSLPSAPNILSKALSFYGRRIGSYIGVTLVPFLVFTGLQLAMISLIGMAGSSKSTIATVGIAIVVLLISPILVVGGSWMQLALLHIMKDSHVSGDGSNRTGIIAAYRLGWHKLLSYWWILFLMCIITVGGLILFIVPGILFSVWFGFAMFIMVAEDIKGTNALLKSMEYVKGRWGGTCWRMVFIELILVLPAVLLTWAFGALQLHLATQIIVWIAALFVNPVMMTYLFFLYRDLKETRGDFPFAPSVAKKATVLFVGVMGCLGAVVFGIMPIALNLTAATMINKSLDRSREAALDYVQSSLDAYSYDHHAYPNTLDQLVPRYMRVKPVDPKTKLPYEYRFDPSSGRYSLCAQFDSKGRDCRP